MRRSATIPSPTRERKYVLTKLNTAWTANTTSRMSAVRLRAAALPPSPFDMVSTRLPITRGKTRPAPVATSTPISPMKKAPRYGLA